jgi:hypothetical protein
MERFKQDKQKAKLSRKDAKARRFRKENLSKGYAYFWLGFKRLCVFFASLRLCVRFFFLDSARSDQPSSLSYQLFFKIKVVMAMKMIV